MKKFQVIIEVEDTAIINTTNKKEEVTKWLNAFCALSEDSEKDCSVKVFEKKPDNSYALVHLEQRAGTENVKPVGFGRW